MKLDAAFFRIVITLCFWLVSLTIINGARILAIFPIAFRSHFYCNVAMLRSLHNAGHEITLVSPFPDDGSLKNYSVVYIKQDPLFNQSISSIRALRHLSFSGTISHAIEQDTKLCEDVLSSSEIQSLMKSKEKHYDVIFIEIIIMFECYLPLAEKLNVPVIGTVTWRSWTLADAVMGNPNNPGQIPSTFSTFSDKMTFLERLQNIWNDIYIHYKYNFEVSKRLKKINDQFYTQDLLNKKQVSLVFINNHLSLLPKLSGTNMIDVGGIHVRPAKPLPENYQKFIDEAEHGVILFSFGSIMKGSFLDPELLISFRDAFSEIPQRVIWKFEEQIENITENVMLSKWIPQRDILAHKNVKAFISHCGISGSYEAFTEGVPMIFTPLVGDQMSNAALLEKLGVGLSLDIHSVTKAKVLEALNAIINDTSYRDKMTDVSKRFKDRPMSPQESIVYWTEYVIRHNGAPSMRLVESDGLFSQYFPVDIMAAMIITTAFCIFISARIIKKLHDLLLKSNK